MSLKTQAKVLRVLRGAGLRAGGRQGHACRWTCGSSPPPTRTCPSASRQGAFREDLFYRLNVIPIEVPPLRAAARRTCPLLVAHFITLFSAENGKRPKTISRRGPRLLPVLRLAGQRARAAQHGRAARDHEPARRHRRPRISRRRSARATRSRRRTPSASARSRRRARPSSAPSSWASCGPTSGT